MSARRLPTASISSEWTIRACTPRLRTGRPRGPQPLRARLGAAVGEAWPAPQFGLLLAWRLEVPNSAASRLTSEHLGAPAGLAADAVLGRSISARSGVALEVRTAAYAPGPFTARAVMATRGFRNSCGRWMRPRKSRVYACVQMPGGAEAGGPVVQEVKGAVRAQATGLPAGRAVVAPGGDTWIVRLSSRPCAPSPAESAARANCELPFRGSRVDARS